MNQIDLTVIVDNIILQLNRLQVTGVTNCALVYDIYRGAEKLKAAIKEVVPDGEDQDRGQGDPV